MVKSLGLGSMRQKFFFSPDRYPSSSFLFSLIWGCPIKTEQLKSRKRVPLIITGLLGNLVGVSS